MAEVIPMNKATILQLVKARLGISSTQRDTYLNAIIDGLIEELEKQQGITLNGENKNQEIFITDYAVWRYQSRDTTGAMPEHLRFRLRNLYVNSGGKKNV